MTIAEIIVTGPNRDLSIKLIRRMKKLFQDRLDVTFDSKETVLELNSCSIEAYPYKKHGWHFDKCVY
jgi:hypothetical protein